MRRMLLTTILSAVALLESGCQSLPPPPKGNTCIGDVARGGVDCVPISRAVRHQAVLKADANSFIPWAQMDNWVCFSPTSWQNIQVYIGEVKNLANECLQGAP